MVSRSRQSWTGMHFLRSKLKILVGKEGIQKLKVPLILAIMYTALEEQSNEWNEGLLENKKGRAISSKSAWKRNNRRYIMGHYGTNGILDEVGMIVIVKHSMYICYKWRSVKGRNCVRQWVWCHKVQVSHYSASIESLHKP